jgi:hypothetical protein
MIESSSRGSCFERSQDVGAPAAGTGEIASFPSSPVRRIFPSPTGSLACRNSQLVDRRYYFLITAAMQLISTNEFPGSAATAIVVRAGPPLGK